MYAIVFNDEIVQYPSEPYVDNPSVSFPLNWGGGEVNGVQYVLVKNQGAPAVNVGWMAVESTPVKDGDEWKQSWTTSLKSKQELKQDVTDIRYYKEISGVTVANNLYATDRESQTKYVAVAVDIQQSNSETWSIVWKTQDNKFVNLNATQMTEVINGVRNHVQACFNKEAEYHNLIDTANNEVLESTDFSAGWPTNS